jgi:hypothetical protein
MRGVEQEQRGTEAVFNRLFAMLPERQMHDEGTG